MKHINVIKNDFLSCLILSLMLIIFLNILLSGYSSGEELSQSIGIISREKTRVEGAALTIIRDKNSSSANYRVCKFYYDDARGAINGWIDSIIFDLRNGKGPDEIDKKINLLSSAVEKSNTLVAFVYRTDPEQLSWKDVKNLLPLLVEALEAIWKEYITGAKDRRDRIISDLERLKVISFQELVIQK